MYGNLLQRVLGRGFPQHSSCLPTSSLFHPTLKVVRKGRRQGRAVRQGRAGRQGRAVRQGRAGRQISRH